MRHHKILLLKSFLLISGVLFSFVGYSQAQNKIDSLQQLVSTTKQDTNRVSLFLKIGKHYRNNIPDTALSYFQKSLDISKKIGSDKYIAENLRFIGIVNKNKGFYDKAEDYYLESLEKFKEIDDKIGVANCYNNIGSLYNIKSSYDKAIEYYTRAHGVYLELNDRKKMAMSYNNIGTVHFIKGAYSVATENYLKSLKITEEISDESGSLGILNNLGLVYVKQKLYEKAIENYLKALKIAKKTNNDEGISTVFSNIGIVSYHQGYDEDDVIVKVKKFDEAIEYFHNSLKISEGLENKLIMSRAYGNIGMLLVEKAQLENELELIKENLDNAEVYYFKSLKISEELSEKTVIAEMFFNISYLYISYADLLASDNNKKHRYLQKAIHYGTKSFTLAEELKALIEKNNSAEVLMEAYTKKGNYKEALNYAQIYMTTKDSLIENEKMRAFHDMTIKYETEKKQQKINLLKEENKTKQQKIKTRNFLSLSLILLLIIIVGFSYHIRQKTKQKLIQKETEIEKYILKIKEYAEKEKSDEKHSHEQYGLTERESEILSHISKGISHAAIAEKVFLSTNTIKYHIKNIYLKLDVRNKIEAINKIKA